jgi:hypothetical protein
VVVVVLIVQEVLALVVEVQVDIVNLLANHCLLEHPIRLLLVLVVLMHRLAITALILYLAPLHQLAVVGVDTIHLPALAMVVQAAGLVMLVLLD